MKWRERAGVEWRERAGVTSDGVREREMCGVGRKEGKGGGLEEVG